VSSQINRVTVLLALSGWYLLVPPINSLRVDRSAPLSTWMQAGSFDSGAQCDERRLEGVQKINEQAKGSDDPVTLAEQEQLTFARCVATDDPRLK
jgi:hypothetical protein